MDALGRTLENFLLRSPKPERIVDESYFARMTQRSPTESSSYANWRKVLHKRKSDPLFALYLAGCWVDFSRFRVLLDAFRAAQLEQFPVYASERDAIFVVNAFNSSVRDGFGANGNVSQIPNVSSFLRSFMGSWSAEERLIGGSARREDRLFPSRARLSEGIKSFAQGFGQMLSYSTQASVKWSTVLFKVNCQNAGYRLSYTPEYWMNPTVFGSSLSTPVTALLEAGRYRFGGENGSGMIWDTAVHQVSDQRTSTVVTAF